MSDTSWDSVSAPDAPPAPATSSTPSTASSPDLDLLVRTVLGEAGGEPDIGQQAVAATIANRARLSGQGIGDVVNARSQFTSLDNPQSRKRLMAIPTSSSAYQRAAANVAAGLAKDPTGGATHFWAPSLQAQNGAPAPKWAQGQQGQQFGHQIFYRLGYGGHAPTAGQSWDSVSAPANAPAATAGQAAPADWDAVSTLATPPAGGFWSGVGDFLTNGRPQKLLGSGVATGIGKTMEGLGELADNFGNQVVVPGFKAIGINVQRPNAVSQVAPAAAPWLKAGQETTPKNFGESLIYGGGNMGISLAPALVDPAALAVTFGAQGANSAADKARAAGKYGTPAANDAISENAVFQGALSFLQLETLLGKPAAYLISKLPPEARAGAIKTALQYGTTALGNAGFGALSQAGENAIVKQKVDPNQSIGEGVPEAAATNLILGSAAHIVGGGHATDATDSAPAGPSAWDAVSEATAPPAADQGPINLPPDAASAPAAPQSPAVPTAADIGAQPPTASLGSDFATSPAASADAWSAVSDPIQPAAAPALGPDLDSQALDTIRQGKPVDTGQGPPLSQFIAKIGGVSDAGGELAAMDADFGRVGRNRITRKTGGLSLDEVAQRAHDAGYFPEVAAATMDGTGSLSPVTGQRVLDAISQELAGRPRYASEPDPTKADLAAHVADWHELLGHMGIDPRATSNAEILRARDQLFGTAPAVMPSEPHVMAEDIPFGMRPTPADWDAVSTPASRPRTVHDQYLADEVLLRSGTVAGDKAAAGELPTIDRSMGPGGRAPFVQTANLADHMAEPAPVYHETSLSSAKGLLGRILAGPRQHANIMVSERPELALGQSGKGVTLELDPTKANGWQPDSLANRVLGGMGGDTAELAITKTVPAAVRAVTVRTRAQLNSLAKDPALARRFDFAGAQPVEGGFRVARKEAAPALASAWDRVSEPVAPASETVQLADGSAEQGLIPGVAAASDTARQIAALQARMDARRGAAQPMPQGGLFDATARAQTDLFDQPPRDRADVLARGLPDAWDEVSHPANDDGLNLGGDRLGMARPNGPKIDVSDRGIREAPTPGAVPAAVERGQVKGFDGQTIAQMIDRLRKSLGLTIRQGRMTLGRGAVGEFDPATGVIRTRHGFDVNVLAHEAGHALEHKMLPSLNAAIQAHKAEVAAMHYPGANVQHTREEGFAEFTRWYLTNPDHALKQAPNFYPAFEAALAKDRPQLAQDLKAMQAGYRAYMGTSSVNAVASSIVTRTKNTLFKKLGDDVKELGPLHAVDKWMNDLYTGRIDQLHPLKQGVDELLAQYAKNRGQRLDLRVADDPYKLYRMVPGAHASGHMDLLYGVRPYQGVEPEGRGLAQIVTDAMGQHWTPKRWTEFGAYLVSRRMMNEYQRAEDGKFNRPPDRFSKAAHEQVVRDLEGLNPGWKAAGDQVHEFNSLLLKRDVAAGFVSQEQFDGLQAEHPFYVPLRRDRSDLTTRGSYREDRTQRNVDVVKSMEGSDRDYIHPVQSMIENAYSSSERTFRNEALRALLDLAEKVGPGSGAIVERLPAHEMRAVNVDIRAALEKAARSQGVHPRDIAPIIDAASEILDNEMRATVYRPGGINERGEPILHVWKDGEAIPIRLPDGEFGRQMFKAVVGMSQEAKTALLDVVDVLRKPAQLLRLGVTTTPRFFVKNLFVDQFLTWLTSDVKYKPFVSAARGLGDDLNQSGASRVYNAMGGISGGANVATIDKARIERDMHALDRRGYKVARFKSFEGLIHLSESSETATRIGVARLAMQRAKAEGESDYAAWKEGAFYARDLRDFDRHGTKMLAFLRTIPFLNANIQGIDKMRRVLGAEGNLKKLLIPAVNDMRGVPLSAQDKRLLALSTKALVSVLATSVLATMLRATNADDPEFQRISPYLKATHYIFRGPGGHWIFLPKPYEAAAPGNIMEESYEALAKHDPNAWGRMLAGLNAVLMPNFAPTALEVPYELGTNRNFVGSPIVPDNLKNVDPELQYGERTTAIAKWIGGLIHWSPARVDYLMTSMLGGWGQTLQDVSNSVEAHAAGTMPALRPEDTYLLKDWVRDTTRGSQTVSDFYDQVGDDGKLSRDLNTFRLMMKDRSPAEAASYFNAMTPPERGYLAASALGGVIGELHPMNRAKQEATIISDLRRDMRGGAIRGPDLKTAVQMSPEQRRDVYASLDVLRDAELRNAQIATGAPGYVGKQPIDLAPVRAALFQASPEVASALLLREQTDHQRVPDQQATAVWQNMRPRLEGLSAQQLEALENAKRYRGIEGIYRLLRTPPGQEPFRPAA